MKIVITIIENIIDKVFVKNVGDVDYRTEDLVIEVAQEKEVRTGLAKNLFGDWEDNSFGELQRQKDQNIHLIDIKIQTKPAQIQEKEEGVVKSIDKTKVEPEFPALKEKEEVEPIQCVGKTKAGKQCKNVAEEGSKFCKFHKGE